MTGGTALLMGALLGVVPSPSSGGALIWAILDLKLDQRAPDETLNQQKDIYIYIYMTSYIYIYIHVDVQD